MCRLASLAQCWVVGGEGVCIVSGGWGGVGLKVCEGWYPKRKTKLLFSEKGRNAGQNNRCSLLVAGQGVGSMEQAGELIGLKWILLVAYSIRGGL